MPNDSVTPLVARVLVLAFAILIMPPQSLTAGATEYDGRYILSRAK